MVQPRYPPPSAVPCIGMAEPKFCQVGHYSDSRTWIVPVLWRLVQLNEVDSCRSAVGD